MWQKGERGWGCTCSFPLHVHGWGLGLGFASTDPPDLPDPHSRWAHLQHHRCQMRPLTLQRLSAWQRFMTPHHDVCHPRKQHSHPWRNRHVFLISNLVVSCSRVPSLSVRNSSYCGGGISQGHDKHFTVLIKGPYMCHISFYMSCWNALSEADVHCVLGLMAV